jgi:hypothetical protein
MDKAMSIDINQREVNDLILAIDRSLKQISDTKERKRINEGAARFVVNAARGKAPRSKKVHYAYNTPKLVKSQRAKRGSSEKYRVEYLPGNLQLSIRKIGGLRRTIRAIIGPRILRRARAKTYGRNRNNVNAYYAQMIYGSAVAFRQRVMLPALVEQESRVKAYIKREVQKVTKKAAQRNGLA